MLSLTVRKKDDQTEKFNSVFGSIREEDTGQTAASRLKDQVNTQAFEAHRRQISNSGKLPGNPVPVKENLSDSLQ